MIHSDQAMKQMGIYEDKPWGTLLDGLDIETSDDGNSVFIKGEEYYRPCGLCRDELHALQAERIESAGVTDDATPSVD